MIINGTNHDGMDAWHVLNSDLRKSLGFVTPFFGHGYRMWKHLSNDSPALYNAMDAAAAGTNFRGTVKLLKQNSLWQVYNDFVCELDPVFSAMTRAGMPVDLARRINSSKLLQEKRTHVRRQIEALVPDEIRPHAPANGYVRPPKDTSGLVEIVLNAVRTMVCSVCGVASPRKSHFKPKPHKLCAVCGRKWTQSHVRPRKGGSVCEGAGVREVESNQCAGAAPTIKVEGERRWARRLPFVASPKGIMNYMNHFGHPIIMVGKGSDRKATTDEKAIKKLIGRHPDHDFYKLILEDRELTKLGGAYIGWYSNETGKIEGGFPLGRDGAVHGHFRHTPSTLRSSMVSPNLQNLPRGDAKDAEAVANLVKAMFVAPPGYIFVARDFCVDPESKVLKADLTWSAAKDLKVGDELIGFDDSVGLGHKHRFKSSTVRHSVTVEKEKVRVITSAGTTIVSSDHPLIARRLKYKREWIKAKDLQPGMRIAFLGRPWETDESHSGGYLAGFLDGEGYCHRTNVGFGQNEGPVLSYVLSLLKEKGYDVSQRGRGQRHKDKVQFQYEGISGLGEQLRLLGSIRPARLLPKARSMWEGRRTWGKKSPMATVLAVEPLGAGPVVALETSSKTFISDGFFSHNCGIEALLVGYHAGDRDFMRLAKTDIHSFFTGHNLVRQGVLTQADLPSLAWSDADLIAYGKEVIKRRFKDERDIGKRCIHAGDYRVGPHKLSEEYPEWFPKVKDAAAVLRFFYELFPKINEWHERLCRQVDKSAVLKNSFGHVHRFYQVLKWTKHGSQWDWEYDDDSKRAIAFGPQSDAAFIGKAAIKRCYYDYPDSVALWLRLFIHDELFCLCPIDRADECDEVLKLEMERPLQEMPLPLDWGFGPLMQIGSEGKRGPSWDAMH